MIEVPNEETVEVIQEGMSYPQPTEEETKEAIEELMNELSGMVDQVTQTPPPKPSLEEAFNSKVKLVGVYDSPEAFSQAMKEERKANRSKYQTPPPEDDNEGFKRMARMATIFQSPAFSSSVDYMVCPRHQVCLEERVSQKGWEYVKCPMYPCLLLVLKRRSFAI